MSIQSRRDLLLQSACGFGSLALAGLGNAAAAGARSADPLAPRKPMLPPRAKRVIFIFMGGGPSQVDTFDYKPDLFTRDQTEIDFTGVRSTTFGVKSQRKLMKPMWEFSQHGESGQYVSTLFPEMAKHVDKMCFIHSMHTEGVAHGPSTLFLHTGATNLVRPSVGSWITYGLGTENENLPGFVTVSPSDSKGGPRNYSNGFLPTIYQGTALGRSGQPSRNATIRNIETKLSPQQWRRQFETLQRLNALQQLNDPDNDVLDASIRSYELAYRMQMHAPELLNLDDEPESVLAEYGINEKATEDFGYQCLIARKLAEAGVRYIQINYSDESANPRWDQHSNMPKHAQHAKAIDQPCAALLEDLSRRGLLEDTLVWWGGEFGRTPFSQNNNGRDHNPRGFTVWLAGGGVKTGYAHGETDEIGHYAVSDKVHMHDLHATVLHMLGLDHKRLTYQYAGREFRLTDVYGRVVNEILA